MSEFAKRPIVIFICLHFWRKEWWHSRWCHECTDWIRALITAGNPNT